MHLHFLVRFFRRASTGRVASVPPPGSVVREPRVFEPVRASYDYWESFLDAKRKSAIGAIEPLEGWPAQR